MSFIIREGESITLFDAKKASTVMAQMAVLDWSGGFLQPAVNSSTALAGVLQYSIATTDSDYALATQVPILTLTDKTVWEANVHDTSLIAATLIGTYVDLQDSLSLDLSSSTYGQFLITAINTATGTVHGHFNSSALYVNAAKTVSSGQAALQYKDEGVNLGTAGTATSVDFVGAGVTATRAGNAVTVTIPAAAPAAGGLSAYGSFFQTVYDVGATIAADNGKALFHAASGVNTAGDFTMIADSGDITVNTSGDYEINWEVTCAEPGALGLFIGAGLQTGTVFGTGAGTQNINGSSLLTLTAGDVVSLRTVLSPAALTLQLSGTTSTAEVVCGITFKKLS